MSPVHEVEQDRFGWGYAQLGELILRWWGMPEEVQAAARCHHWPEFSLKSKKLTKPTWMAVCCVSLADYLSSRSGWAAMGRAGFVPPNPQVFEVLGIDADLLAVLWQQLYAVLDAATQLK